MATEHDLQRTHIQVVDADFDVSDVTPNRTTPSSQLTAPAQPWTSGILHRKARDANGVEAGAEDAVAAASGSSGSALPTTLMRKFEASLGTDLSGVRVHSGAESHAAAEAVGAHAYAVGSDIHFNAGKYDPSSTAGEHLLAHEVAHTVQQAGDTSTRQHKLEVSAPFDASEHEADRAADAMVSGAGFSISTAAGGASRRKIQRERKFDWNLGGKVTGGDGFAKATVDGSAKVEQPLKYVTISGQVSIGGEAEVKWKPDANTSAGVSGKGTTGKDGKQGFQLEEEVPLWKETAKKAAQEHADRTLSDYLMPVEASLVLGSDGSDKPGKGDKAGEMKGAIAAGIKCKTKSGDSYTVKIQFFELKKTGNVLDVSGPAVKGNYDKKFKSDPVAVPCTAGATVAVTGNVKPEFTFKPNWEDLAGEFAKQAAKELAEDAILAAIDAAALAGPPLLIAALIGHSIYIAGEKGKRDSDILVGAKDAAQGAMAYAQLMCGCDGIATGPISQQAIDKGRAEMAKIAAKNNVSVDAMMFALRNKTSPKDFSRIYNETTIKAKAAYHDKVAASIAAWLKEHYIAAAFTTQSDEVNAVWRSVEMVWH